MKECYMSNYLLGNIYMLGKLDDKKIQLKKANLYNPSGVLEFQKGNLSLGKTAQLNTTFNIKHFDLRILLHLLKIKQTPVKLEAKGKVNCYGEIYPETSLTCTSKKIQTKNLKIFEDSKDKKLIIQSEPINISGQSTINLNEVNYQALLKSDHGSAVSSGTVHYKKGFNIDFKSSHLVFKQFLERIANLKIEGSTEFSGSTRGTSKYATVNVKSKMNDLWIENYFLGKATLNLKLQ